MATMFWIGIFVLLSSALQNYHLLSLPKKDVDYTHAMVYLMKYGYMEMNHSSEKTASLLSPDYLSDHLKKFQGFAGINQTGELDEETIRYMNMPRCGVKDNLGNGFQRRRKRYALQGSKWKVKEITYGISRFPSSTRLSKRQVTNQIRKSFDIWSKHADLNFTYKEKGKVHIDIRFVKRAHGDGDPFDGPGGTLAHAFFPIFGGDMHLDDDEYWTKDTFRGTDLTQTAAHEIGHSLGLSHSEVNSALMAPFYRGYERNVRLRQDDIEAINALYGPKKRKIKIPTTTTSSTSNDEENTELCDDPKIDTIVPTKDGSTYAFKGSNYWKLNNDSVASGYPRKIIKDWAGLPTDLDAGFMWNNGRTYVFKGNKYWRFLNRKMDPGFPKLISSGFAGIPKNLDAAFVWSGNKNIYFFKGDKYWRFDPTNKPPVSDTYPKDISNWNGIPNNIDTAIQYINGHSYFFKDGLYWRFDDQKFRVDDARPSFPRQTKVWWFGCQE